MSIGRRIRRAPALLPLMAALLIGCRGDPERPAASTERAPASTGDHARAGADRRSQLRGARMLSEAARCERGAADACVAACELGHSDSCYAAGAALRDDAAALSLYLRACDGGSGLGCEAAGRARRDGRGAARDPAAAEALDVRARFYLRDHCEHRQPRSCLALARLFTTTRGGPASDGAAAAFRSRACQLGLEEACAEAPPAPF